MFSVYLYSHSSHTRGYPFLHICGIIKLFAMSLAKDSRVEKIRKHLRDRTDITKSDFLDFVQVYPYFHEAGWVVRPELLEWIEKHVEAVRSWLPEIWSLRSDYFGDVRPESRYTKFEQYDKLVALGLTGPQSGFRGSPELGSSHAVDMAPIQSRSKALFDFGTPIPEPVIQKRPALLGSCQQKVWLDDINGIHKRLESIKRWMIESAKDLSPDDELKEILPNIAAKIPNIQDRVETAQVCFDQVKVDYDAARSKRKRMRDAMFSRPMYSPTPEVAEQVAATLLDEDMPSTSIRVESDIPPNSDQLISATRISTGQPHLSHSDKPPPSTNVHTTTATATDNSHPARPMIARRSAMASYFLLSRFTCSFQCPPA